MFILPIFCGNSIFISVVFLLRDKQDRILGAFYRTVDWVSLGPNQETFHSPTNWIDPFYFTLKSIGYLQKI